MVSPTGRCSVRALSAFPISTRKSPVNAATLGEWIRVGPTGVCFRAQAARIAGSLTMFAFLSDGSTMGQDVV